VIRSSWRPQPADLALGVGTLAVNLIMYLYGNRPDDPSMWPAGWPLVALSSLALAFRWRFPMTVLVLTSTSAVCYYKTGYPDGPIAIGFVVATYTVASLDRWKGIAGAAAVLFAFALPDLLQGLRTGIDPGDSLKSVLAIGIILVIVLAFGEAARSRRAYYEEVQRRAEAAEQTREEESLRRATEERLRIARELHDVLAHQISLINVQAGAALHRPDAENAFAALENIKQASKETLRELRSLLGVMRQVDEGAPVTPAPTLDRLDDLITHTISAGLPVQLHHDATGPFPAQIELTAYRIIQEALTNVVRHAAATKAIVALIRKENTLIVSVEDDGRGAGVLTYGNGLRGMRERTIAMGGEVTAESVAGGFRVRAELPIEGR
jgi:signal transduction histidine kinase